MGKIKRKHDVVDDDSGIILGCSQQPRPRYSTRPRTRGRVASEAALLHSTVFEVVLSSNLLHWHEALALGQANKECYQIWKRHKHRLLTFLLPILDYMAGKTHLRGTHDHVQLRFRSIDPRFDHGFNDESAEVKSKKLVHFLETIVRNVHSFFDKKRLADPTKLPSCLGNINEWSFESLPLHERRTRAGSADIFWQRFPKRAAFAMNVALLEIAQVFLEEGLNDSVSDAFLATGDFPNVAPPDFTTLIGRCMLSIVDDMSPFTNEDFVLCVEDHFIFKRGCADCLGPLLNKTYILAPLVKRSPTGSSLRIPRGLEKMNPEWKAVLGDDERGTDE